MPQKTLAELFAHFPDHQFTAPLDIASATPDQIMAEQITIDTKTIDNVMIADVTDDSRAVQTGSLFVAVMGDSFDGHRFIAAAIEQGAAAVIGTERRNELAPSGVTMAADFPYIQVRDSRRALALCAAALQDFPSRQMRVIGVTGTDGKTTTSTILESILVAATRDDKFPAGRVGVITTVGARICGKEIETGFHVTTPDAPAVRDFLAQMRDAGCIYAIVESTSHGLAQDRVSAIDFDVACVTNITHEHIDWHGSREAYIAAKALLFRMLFRDDVERRGVTRFAVLNMDDVQNYAGEGSYAPLLAVLDEERERSKNRKRARVAERVEEAGKVEESESAEESESEEVAVGIVRYGVGEGADVGAANVKALPDCTRFNLLWAGGTVEVETHLIGDFNVQNILCAASAALALEILPDAIRRGVADLKGVVGRMERIDAGQPFLALVDFAHSPASLERALMTLRQLVKPACLAETDAAMDLPNQVMRGEAVGTEQVMRAPRLIAVFGSAGLRDVEKRYLMGQVSGRLADFTIITAEDPRTEDLDEINRAIAAGVREFAPEDAFVVVPDRGEAIRRAVEMAAPGDVVAAFGKGHERTICFGETEFPWSDQEVMLSALLDAMDAM